MQVGSTFRIIYTFMDPSSPHTFPLKRASKEEKRSFGATLRCNRSLRGVLPAMQHNIDANHTTAAAFLLVYCRFRLHLTPLRKTSSCCKRMIEGMLCGAEIRMHLEGILYPLNINFVCNLYSTADNRHRIFQA